MDIWKTEEWKSKAKNEKISEAQRDFITSLLENIDFDSMSKLDASVMSTSKCRIISGIYGII